MLTALEQDETPDEAKALLGYGLAKYYNRWGEYNQSAQAGVLANTARRRKAEPLKRSALSSRIDDIFNTYSKSFFLNRQHYGVGTDQPVFIVGLPR